MYFYEKNCSVYNHSAEKLDRFYAIYLLLTKKWLRNDICSRSYSNQPQKCENLAMTRRLDARSIYKLCSDGRFEPLAILAEVFPEHQNYLHKSQQQTSLKPA